MKVGQTMVVLGLAVLGLMVVHLWMGSILFSSQRLWAALCGAPLQAGDDVIVWQFRMPKIGAALVSGASLSVSGLLMQTFFRNPIAGPFVLGISSGASLGVAVALLAAGWASRWLGWIGVGTPDGLVLLLAIGGAALVLGLLLVVSWRIADVNTLLILGLLFGSASGALVALLQYFSSQQALQQYMLWSMGSLTGVTRAQLGWLLPLCGGFFGGVWWWFKHLYALCLGPLFAFCLGVGVRQLQRRIIVATAILAGSSTAFCGPIAFVGIAVPHLARLLFRTHQHRILIAGTALMGMLILLGCQLVAQLPGYELVLPINVVTAFLGAPMVMYLVVSRRRIHT